MTGILKRRVGDLTIRIDRDLYVGFEHCPDGSPTAFRFEDYDVVELDHPENERRSRLVAAASVCSVDALIVIDSEGTQPVPLKDELRLMPIRRYGVPGRYSCDEQPVGRHE